MIVFLTALTFTAATADELYHVTIDSPEAAAKLQATGAEPIVRTSEGYIVLAGAHAAGALAACDLNRRLLASDISREEMSLDQSLDGSVSAPALFQEGSLRLLETAPGALQRTAPLPGSPLKIEYVRPSTQFESSVSMRDVAIELDSLIALVVQDTLYDYVSTLQAFPGRVCGSSGNYQARDWIVSKFSDYGYDSVYTDNFMTNYYNVVATKIGARFPDHQVVVGGHFDAVSGSPGADDNGSGTAGVLELARILSGIETDMTFVFVTFDAEEIGLYGSYDYVAKAMANGDNIVYMFNMDMIGAINNVSDVTVYHGTDLTYSNAYNWLADSLLNVTGHLSGNIAASDHYPFTQQGIPATFIIEYNFSPVYHTYQDSTTWMDFTYMTKLVKSALATTYYVSQTEGPLPSLQFSYPGGVPTTLDPGVDDVFQVQIDGLHDGTLVPSSPALHYNVDEHGWQATSMTDHGDGLYEATIPAADCWSIIRFYVTADEESSGQVADPDPSEPFWAIVASEAIAAFADDFESDLGWTTENLGATSGLWERGVPVDDDNWDYDPATDGDGSGSCYLTENQLGNTDVDDGAVRLTSPVFDMTGGGNISYEYFLRLTNTTGGVDRLLVEITDNEGPWTEIARHTNDGGLYWSHHEVRLDDLAALGVSFGPNMQVRFTANDADPQSIVEAGVDGFVVTRFECEAPYLCGDIDGDGDGPNIADLVYLTSFMFGGGPTPPEPNSVDVNNDGVAGDIADLVYLVTYMFSGGPEPNCP